MAKRPAAALALRDGDRERLVSLTRSPSVRAGLAQRARIVLLAADGMANTRIAELTDATVMTVLNWRGRYQDRGIAGLRDAPRPGRPRALGHRRILAETVKPPPKKLGVTHWSKPVAGCPAQDQPFGDPAGLAVLRGEAVEGGVVPVLHRSRVGREGHRHLRAVPRRPRRRRAIVKTCGWAC